MASENRTYTGMFERVLMACVAVGRLDGFGAQQDFINAHNGSLRSRPGIWGRLGCFPRSTFTMIS